jgi:putative ubiquitin-RnfH superfamily antitoxin RatB of RatAB toxin-antitoxin module
MSDSTQVSVEVAYALPEQQRLLGLEVPAGTTARDALRLSALKDEFPELDIEQCSIGIFGREIDGGQVLVNGDRVEIYRPLLNDPRETRRKLAAHGTTMGSAADGLNKGRG